MYCKHCGLQIAPEAVCCPRCGRPTRQEESTAVYVLKSIPTALLIWFSCVLIMIPICNFFGSGALMVIGVLVLPVVAVVLVFLRRYEKRKVYQRFWFWLIAFCVALLFWDITSGSPVQDTNQDPHAVIENTGSTQAEQTKPETEPETTPGTQPVLETVTDDDGPIVVGNIISYNGITVQLVGVTENNGSEYNEPAAGNVFVLCEFEIANNSGEDISISSLMSFEAYVDDYSTDTSFGAEMSTDKGTLDGTIASGKKMRGVIGYELPKNWSTIEIRFTPDFWSGDEFIFTYNK